MTVNELLNSDMATLKQEFRRWFDWWIDELARLVPDRAKSWQQSRRNVLHFVGDGAAGLRGRAVGRGPFVIAVGEENVLIRSVTTPAMTSTDLDRMLALNCERYLPVAFDSAVLSTSVRGMSPQENTMLTDIALLPMARANVVADVLQREMIMPRAIRVSDAAGMIDPRFNFLPAMRKAGLITSAGGMAQRWWIVVAALVVLTMAAAVWRDVADVDRLQRLVDAQKPAVAVAQRISGQMRGLDAIARNAAGQRGRSDALTWLGLVTAAVPDGAWVQRFAWTGSTMRLEGYRSPDTDVAAALRKLPRVAKVTSGRPDATTEIATGQPFDAVVTYRAR